MSQGLTFEVEIDGGVLVGGVWAGMAKPLADSRQVYTGLQKGDCGTVAEAVGMQSFTDKARNLRFSSIQMLPQQVADSEASERFAPVIQEDMDV